MSEQDKMNNVNRYGLVFPSYATDVCIELKCYAMGHTVEAGGLGKAVHLKRAIKLLYPEYDNNGNPVYVWHDWLDRRIEAWCDNSFMTWWGPAAAAKSTDAAVIALVDWYADPIGTTTIICSTTLKMLQRRIFGEAVRFHNKHKGGSPGIYLKSKTAIVVDQKVMESASEKSGIFGFAVQLGDKKQARDDIIRQHNKRIRLLVDEAQHPALEVAFDSRSNLMKGCEDFKLVGFGNPDSRLDPLGRFSEPVNGWESISPDMPEWNTKYGKCFFFDGMTSPGMKDPKKYWFMVKQQDFEDTAGDFGADSPEYWQFCRGFVRPEGSTNQIISETFAIKHHMTAGPEWASGYQLGAGFDPSYSAGGDKRMIVPFQVGLSTADIQTIAFLEPYQVTIDVSELSEKTMARQMAEKAIAYCKELGVPKNLFGMDTTGAQNILADFIDEIWDEDGKIYRCQFGGRASDLQASQKDTKLAHDVYANRVTELWFNMVTFGQNNQIRGLPLQALKEFTMREVLRSGQMRLRTTKRQIEPKVIMKNRTGGKSPDTADACVVGLDLVRQRINVHPGDVQTQKYSRESDAEAVDLDLDGREDNYLTDSIEV